MSPQLLFVIRRLLLTVPVLLAMSIFVFLMIRLVPGDPVRIMLGFRANPTNVAIIRHELGFDRPLPEQYLSWLGGVLHGDLGQDFITHASLTELLAQRLPVTLELTVLAMLVSLVLGIPLGVLGAVGHRLTVRLTDVFVVAGVSIPAFWLGIMLVLLFTGVLRVLPPSGYIPFTVDPLENVRHMILPVLTLAAGEAAYILRTTKAVMEEVLESPFIAFLRAKGITERSIVFKHALRNAAVPIVTIVGIQFGALLGGAIVIETLFSLPGVGLLIVSAINERNYAVVQGGVLTVATLFILVNLATDLLYGVLDPRTAAGGQVS
ncbi:MAG TPA: ABC transporter permease [Candidatus Dormibacteraeota bacterium]|nr:ABC transporter permease [Candidatus Dormibacteraeota bacterium]